MDIRRRKARVVEQRKYGRVRVLQKINLHGYDYIEKLINRPLDDFRKYCIWKIFVPYFINVKRLSRIETFNIVKPWLDRCKSVCKLSINLFIYESCPSDEKIEDVLFMQIQILNLD
jgi:hypothetical protein